MFPPIRAAVALLYPKYIPLGCAVRRAAIVAFLSTVAGTATVLPAEANTYTVNSTGDDPDAVPGDEQCLTLGGQCTLRAAIQEANDPDAPADPRTDDTILFSLGTCSGWCTIVLASPLPPLTDNGTTIDGFTGNSDWGSKGSKIKPGVLDSYNDCQVLSFRKPRVAIDGPDNGSAFTIAGMASNITIRGLSIYDTGITGANHAAVNALGTPGGGMNRLVEGMFVGILPNGYDPGMANRNRGFGVRQRSGGPLEVRTSFVGYNGEGGIDGEANASVLIAEQNEILQNGWATNSHDGLDINGIDGLARCNYSHDNTNLSKTPEGDSGSGLELGSQARLPGRDIDTNRAEYNTLYKNVSAGLSIRKGPRGDFYTKNVIWHNHVGISVNTEDNRTTNRHLFSKNSIFRNKRLGIDLQHDVTLMEWQGEPDHVTPNDHCDPDTGGTDGSLANTASNDLQNFPILKMAKRHKKKTTISGTLNSTPGTAMDPKWYRIEFFATPAADLFNFVDPNTGVDFIDREGKIFLGHTLVKITDPVSCMTTFDVAITSGVPDNHRITATARLFEDDAMTPEGAADDPWSTSEFSNGVKPPQEDSDDFDSDGKRDDEDSDDDGDGRKDEEDSDDDNDGQKDDEDSDDDSDGVKDRHDHKGYKEKQDSDTDRLDGGQTHLYQMSVDSSSLLLIAEAVEAAQDPLIPDDPDELLGDPLDVLEQPLLVEIYDPLGNLIASSPPTPGPAIAAAVPVGAGTYTVNVVNRTTREVIYDSYRLIREVWPPPPPPLLP